MSTQESNSFETWWGRMPDNSKVTDQIQRGGLMSGGGRPIGTPSGRHMPSGKDRTEGDTC